ncbi:MAG: S-adenosyl-l-methionine hydroxide adenosyltransferase family protein [Gemmatimonadota bacterium]
MLRHRIARSAARRLLGLALVSLSSLPLAGQRALVFQTDFGLAEGSIAEMKGVAYSVSPSLHMFDLTHLIPPYDIWEAAVRLRQAAPFWPPGTVFVSIVDPGVGTARKSIVVKARSGHFFVGPDNGSFTFIAEQFGIESVREIDETVNRLPGSERSHTFHGRDIFGYTGARLAAGVIEFDQVGPALGSSVVMLPHMAPSLAAGRLTGAVLTEDQPYGNVWTNIPARMVDSLGVKVGDTVAVVVRHGATVAFRGRIPFVKSFGAVRRGQPLAYLDSMLDFALALDQGSFAGRYRIGRGKDWVVEVRSLTR